jgi:hypothetical protein
MEARRPYVGAILAGPGKELVNGGSRRHIGNGEAIRIGNSTSALRPAPSIGGPQLSCTVPTFGPDAHPNAQKT